MNFAALDRPGQPPRIGLRSTAVRVEHDGDPDKSTFVWVTYAQEEKVFRLKARSAVLAGGSWTSKHIVSDLPSDCREAYNQFNRSPCMLANVAARCKRRLTFGVRYISS